MGFKKLAFKATIFSSISKSVVIQQISNWVYAFQFSFKNLLSFTLLINFTFGLLLKQFQMLFSIKVKPSSINSFNSLFNPNCRQIAQNYLQCIGKCNNLNNNSSARLHELDHHLFFLSHQVNY
jgi:hypothetical protein